jgi:hypothetical protein
MKNKYVASATCWWLAFVWLTSLSLPLTTFAQSPLLIGQVVYDCTTGNVTILTAGGNGSPITFTAPGITRSSPTSTTGVVESGLRNDPKPITITARQSGQTATYTLDLVEACSRARPPVLLRPIPDLSVTVGQSLTRFDNPAFTISQYFSDPNMISVRYKSLMRFVGSGLPEGMYLNDYSTDDLPRAYIEGTPTVSGVYTVTVVASLPVLFTLGDTRTTTTFRITVSAKPDTNSPGPITTPPAGGSLTLTQPTYNCATGGIIFNTSGGSGAPITFNAPGVSRSSPTSTTGVVELGLRSDPKPITIQAVQSGKTVSYTFDFGTYCASPQPPVTPPQGGALILLAPTYDCTTGTFRFNTSGGNNSPIQYQAIGITGWTTNPNQAVDRESRTASDVKPFTLMARQNGVTVSYVWDLKAACGRARQGAGERTATLSVVVLGNPVSDAVTVEIRGAESQPLLLRLIDLQGRLLESRLVNQAGEVERHRFELLPQSPGLLLLRASSGKQSQAVKIVKH